MNTINATLFSVVKQKQPSLSSILDLMIEEGVYPDETSEVLWDMIHDGELILTPDRQLRVPPKITAKK